MLGVIGPTNGVEPQGGIDVPEPGGHGGGLLLAHGGAQGLQLAVSVAAGDHIVVYNGELADAAAGQTLGGVAAHAAEAEEDHVGLFQALLGLSAPEHLIAKEEFIHAFVLTPAQRDGKSGRDRRRRSLRSE